MWNTREMTYKNLTANYKNFTIVSNRMDPTKYMHYIQDLNLMPYQLWNHDQMYGDIVLHKMLNFRSRTLTLWQGDFTRQPRMYPFENLFCLIEGTELFRVVSPIFRDNLYVGHFENWPPHEAPFSFF